MKKSWRLIFVVLVIIFAVGFLFIKNNGNLDNQNIIYNKNNDHPQAEYRSPKQHLSFKYSEDIIQVEEDEAFISLYKKIDHKLLLTVSSNNCDVAFYNNLEKITFGNQSFRKLKDADYFTIHPKTGFCVIISLPVVTPVQEDSWAERKFIDDFVKNLSFDDGGLTLANYEFTCNDGKSITASFVNGDTNSVTLNLSDERAFSLVQAISASGARYTNKDGSIVFWNKGDAASLEESGQSTFVGCLTTPKEVSTEIDNKVNKIANPASTNCLAKGGSLEIKTKEDGSQYGLCYFDDARACEEWALLRGECPIGGVKTTGYDNLAQKYCAWLGGQTVAEENSVCIFNDNSTCLNSDLYLDVCKKGDWPQK